MLDHQRDHARSRPLTFPHVPSPGSRWYDSVFGYGEFALFTAGGNWEVNYLREYDDRFYTIPECHRLCFNERFCGGFSLHRNTSVCQIYRHGCTYTQNAAWDYYAMADCIPTDRSNGRFTITVSSFDINRVTILYYRKY